MKRTKARNQRKRGCKDACLTAVVVLLWATVAVMMFRAWAEHPAEQPISGRDYIQTVGGDTDGLS